LLDSLESCASCSRWPRWPRCGSHGFVVSVRRLATIGYLLQVLTGAIGVFCLNATPRRTLHHLTVAPYQLVDMSQSILVQASVSVFWALCELAAMIWATRCAHRVVWFVGGALLAATVVKLFLFDLSHVSGVGRIVS
jgi:uncharacterized membrane protein